MAVFLAWHSVPLVDEPVGPWREVRRVADDVLLVDSSDSLSAVYHAVKWSLPSGAALLVAPLVEQPKLRGLPPGTQSWLRRRLSAG